MLTTKTIRSGRMVATCEKKRRGTTSTVMVIKRRVRALRVDAAR
jgi:hypothetical protein